MSEEDIDDLEYMKDGTPTIVPRFQRGRIKAFFGYISYRKHQKNPIGVDWTSVTLDELNQYRVSDYFIFHLNKTLPPGLHSYLATSVNPYLLAFKRGINRDPSQFTLFKHEKYWDTWNRETNATAHAQNIEQVLDHTYVPLGPDQHDLF